MFENDHTDAEIMRREHEYEMGDTELVDSQQYKGWAAWSEEVENLLIDVGATTPQRGLDGSEAEDGFSIDYAYTSFEAGLSPADYFADVLIARGQMGFRDGDAA